MGACEHDLSVVYVVQHGSVLNQFKNIALFDTILYVLIIFSVHSVKMENGLIMCDLRLEVSVP